MAVDIAADLLAVESDGSGGGPGVWQLEADVTTADVAAGTCTPATTATVASSCIVTINAMGWQKRIAQTITMSLLRGSHSRSCMRPWLTKQSCMPLRFAKTLNRPFPYSRIHDILE